MATITFYGAAQQVTGSCHLVESPAIGRILLDCGMHQGADDVESTDEERFGFDPAGLDAVILSRSRDWRIEPTYSKHANRHHGRCDQQGLQGAVWMQEGKEAIATNMGSEFGQTGGAIQGFRGPLAKRKVP